VPGLVLLLVGLLTATTSAAEDRILRAFPYVPGLAITVNVSVGDVSIVAWPRNEIALDVARRLPEGAGPERLPIHIDMEEGGLRIDARQPNGGKDRALRADVILKVPAQAALPDIEIVEGRLDIEGIHGTVTAQVHRGAIVGRDVGGLLRLETGEGDITIDRAHLSSEGLIRCRTFTGNVRVSLADRPANARILLLSLRGTVTSSLPLVERHGAAGQFREATLGPGQFLVSIDVVRGDIVLDVP
jgi:hypothetical protein